MPMYRKLPSSKIQAIVRVKGYPQHNKTFSTREAAKLWAVRFEDSLRSGQLDNTGLTVVDIINEYMERNVDRKCYKRDSRIAQKQIDLWHGIRANEFTLLHLNEYKKYRLKSVKSGTVRKDCGFIRRAWNNARMNGYTLPDLFSTFQLPPAGKPRERIPTAHELDMILGNCSELLSAVIEFASLTAMRRSEILGIDSTCVDVGNSIATLYDTKNGSTRVVPLCKRSMELLEQWGYAFDIKPDSVTQGFSRACKRVDINGLCFHSLRHYAITKLTERGFSPTVVCQISGHKDLRVFLNYNHVDMAMIAKRL